MLLKSSGTLGGGGGSKGRRNRVSRAGSVSPSSVIDSGFKGSG